jgi:hypothetical protein
VSYTRYIVYIEICIICLISGHISALYIASTTVTVTVTIVTRIIFAYFLAYSAYSLSYFAFLVCLFCIYMQNMQTSVHFSGVSRCFNQVQWVLESLKSNAGLCPSLGPGQHSRTRRFPCPRTATSTLEHCVLGARIACRITCLVRQRAGCWTDRRRTPPASTVNRKIKYEH